MNKLARIIFNFFKLGFSPVLIFSMLFVANSVFSQTDKKTEITALLNTKIPSSQKVYIQMDKPNYTVGDTLWFKSYVLNTNYLNNLLASEILYVEVLDENLNLIKRQLVPQYYGMGLGSIVLSDKNYSAGNYVLRAYTNWMRNFDANYFLERSFAITIPTSNEWLINSKMSVQEQGTERFVNANLQLTDAIGNKVALKDLEVSLLDGKKVSKKIVMKTDVTGGLNFKFPLAKNLFIQLKTVSSDNNAYNVKLPIILKQEKNIDIQFLPESGDLINGLTSKVGFKAIGEDGLGVKVSGTIYNNLQQPITKFSAVHLGMGSFYLTPKIGETYTASIKQADGSQQSYPLPVAKKSGILFSVTNKHLTDSLQITISATADKKGSSYYFIGQSRGIGCYGGLVKVTDSIMPILINKNLFPSGIIKFTLLDEQKLAVCERLVFNTKHDFFDVIIKTDKIEYDKRDSVGLTIAVSDEKGNPVQGGFSLAVTDDGQVNLDTIKNENLLSRILLISELNGYIEEPGYYFPKKMTAEIWDNLDHLLLTQGWISYNWVTKYSKTANPIFKHEPFYGINGKVSNVLNKPLSGAKIVLLSKKPSLLLETVTNANGIFTFNNLKPADSAVYFIQARNKNNKSFNVGIKMDEFLPPKFNAIKYATKPWFLNVDTATRDILKNRVENFEAQNKLSGKQLKEVVIKGKRIIKDSYNLNDGESDLTLSEADMNKAGKKTLGEILFQNISGFMIDERKQAYFIRGDQLVHLVIDGVDVNFARPREISLKDYIRNYLDFITAEDIKGIEVMRSPGMIKNYAHQFLHPLADFNEHAFIEITTFSGNGAFMNKTPGTYLFKPLNIVYAHKFYSPKYSVKSNITGIDSRSTVYWNPNVVTDKNGIAKVAFYTTDKKGPYTLLFEGSNMNGIIGSAKSKIIVK